MDKLSIEELKELIKNKKKTKQKRKQMKFGKKMLLLGFATCAILIFFTMVMIVMGKDTTSLTILAGAGVGMITVMFGIYDHYSTKINLKHMEKNYIENYDEERGLY